MQVVNFVFSSKIKAAHVRILMEYAEDATARTCEGSIFGAGGIQRLFNFCKGVVFFKHGRLEIVHQFVLPGCNRPLNNVLEGLGMMRGSDSGKRPGGINVDAGVHQNKFVPGEVYLHVFEQFATARCKALFVDDEERAVAAEPERVIHELLPAYFKVEQFI